MLLFSFLLVPYGYGNTGGGEEINKILLQNQVKSLQWPLIY